MQRRSSTLFCNYAQQHLMARNNLADSSHAILSSAKCRTSTVKHAEQRLVLGPGRHMLGPGRHMLAALIPCSVPTCCRSSAWLPSMTGTALFPRQTQSGDRAHLQSHSVLQEQFIVAKYAERRFVAGPSDPSPGALERAVWAAVEDSDLRWGCTASPLKAWGSEGYAGGCTSQRASEGRPCCLSGSRLRPGARRPYKPEAPSQPCRPDDVGSHAAVLQR